MYIYGKIMTSFGFYGHILVVENHCIETFKLRKDERFQTFLHIYTTHMFNHTIMYIYSNLYILSYYILIINNTSYIMYIRGVNLTPNLTNMTKITYLQACWVKKCNENSKKICMDSKFCTLICKIDRPVKSFKVNFKGWHLVRSLRI